MKTILIKRGAIRTANGPFVSTRARRKAQITFALMQQDYVVPVTGWYILTTKYANVFTDKTNPTSTADTIAASEGFERKAPR